MCPLREYGQIGKTLKPVPGRSTRAITHLIPEVRPCRANALRCSKTLPAFLSLTRDAFLFCPYSLRVELMRCCQSHSALSLPAASGTNTGALAISLLVRHSVPAPESSHPPHHL
ncbi:hypothetical protein D9O29_18505 [Pantoea vagans]|uniref:Uncharacterized protein n=1 Tax=Pantoea vagans TaxID=470934 RepID=A0ABY3LBI8_9GAMM|nr:hypothetical protein D9O29_18505 [Pantoea vagans]